MGIKRGVASLGFLAAAALFISCEKDPDRLYAKCLAGHYIVEVVPLGLHDIEQRRFVCDNSLPLVRWRHQSYRLGEVYTDAEDLKDVLIPAR